jgi:hypothetical protein
MSCHSCYKSGHERGKDYGLCDNDTQKISVLIAYRYFAMIMQAMMRKTLKWRFQLNSTLVFSSSLLCFLSCALSTFVCLFVFYFGYYIVCSFPIDGFKSPIGIKISGIKLNQRRDIYSIWRWCWNDATHKLKVHYGQLKS